MLQLNPSNYRSIPLSRPNRIARVLSHFSYQITVQLCLATAICCLGSALPAGAAGLTVDKRVTTHQSAASTTITSPALTTKWPSPARPQASDFNTSA